MAEITEFNIGQGETFRILTTITDNSSSATFDITNYDFTGQVRENYSTNEIAATFTITKPNGSNFTWACTRTKVLTNTSDPVCYHGQSTAISWDKAIVRISGSATGTNAAGEIFTNTLTVSSPN